MNEFDFLDHGYNWNKINITSEGKRKGDKKMWVKNAEGLLFQTSEGGIVCPPKWEEQELLPEEKHDIFCQIWEGTTSVSKRPMDRGFKITCHLLYSAVQVLLMMLHAWKVPLVKHDGLWWGKKVINGLFERENVDNFGWSFRDMNCIMLPILQWHWIWPIIACIIATIYMTYPSLS